MYHFCHTEDTFLSILQWLFLSLMELSKEVILQRIFNTKHTMSFQTIYNQELDSQPNSMHEKIPFQVARKAMQEFHSRWILVSPDSMQEFCTKLQASKFPPAFQGLYQGHCLWDMPLPRKSRRSMFRKTCTHFCYGQSQAVGSHLWQFQSDQEHHWRVHILLCQCHFLLYAAHGPGSQPLFISGD